MTPEEAKQYLEDKLEEDLELLSPKDRVALYFGQVLEYFQPKRQRTSLNQNESELPKDIYDEKQN